MNEIDVKIIREQLGCTQGTLAEKLGVSIRTVQNWENGKVVPSTKLILLRNIIQNIDMEKNMKERICEFINYKGISVSRFELVCQLGNGAVSKMGTNTRQSTIDRISKAFPELNTVWLRTGQGEMLNPIQQGGIHSIASAPHAISAVNSTVNAQGASCTPHAPANEICIVPEEVSELPDTDVYELVRSGGLNEAERLNAVGRHIRIDMYWRVREDAMMPRFMRGDILALAALPEGAMFPNGSPMVVDTRPFGFVFRRVYDAGDALDCRVANAESGYADTVMQKSQVIRLYRVVGMVRLGQ